MTLALGSTPIVLAAAAAFLNARTQPPPSARAGWMDLAASSAAYLFADAAGREGFPLAE